MTDASLRGDCSRCVGLCCVALAFDRDTKFAFDKAAGEACRHLEATNGCAIHARLAAEGMTGCASYDCRGAGQIATALFAATSWRDHPATARLMFAAFAKLREIQLLRALVGDRSAELMKRLAPVSGWTLAGVMSLDMAAIRREAAAALAPAAETGASGRHREIRTNGS